MNAKELVNMIAGFQTSEENTPSDFDDATESLDRLIRMAREIKESNCQEQLEALVDKHGICEVVETIAKVCAEKSQHIEENWQDYKLARNWLGASHILDATSNTYLKRVYGFGE